VRAVPDAVPRGPVQRAAAGVQRPELVLEDSEVVPDADEVAVAGSNWSPPTHAPRHKLWDSGHTTDGT
jgi:hypothetical protein